MSDVYNWVLFLTLSLIALLVSRWMTRWLFPIAKGQYSMIVSVLYYEAAFLASGLLVYLAPLAACFLVFGSCVLLDLNRDSAFFYLIPIWFFAVGLHAVAYPIWLQLRRPANETPN